MLRRLGIRAKVMAVLAVPMIVLLVAGAYISYGSVKTYQSASAASEVIKTLEAYKPLSSAIEAERVATLTGAPKKELAAAQAQTDAALADVREVTGDLDLSLFPTRIVNSFEDVQMSYNTNLVAARNGSSLAAGTGTAAFNYAEITNGELELVAQIATYLDNRDVGASLNAFGSIQGLSNKLVTEMIQGLVMSGGGSVNTITAAAYDEAARNTETARAQSAEYVNRLDTDIAMPAGQPTSRFSQERLRLTSGSETLVNQLVVPEYVEDVNTQLAGIVETSDAVLERAATLASNDVASSRQTAILTIGITIAAVVLSLLFALFIARGIVNPLRRLTSAASNVREQLPRLVEQVATPGEGPEITLAPIPVTSMDEVGRLAAAFNSVNATTVAVAQEQAALRGSIAEMFVNVARRDQVLLNRQLSFIDSLERAEEDPSTLANLFRLDHLATRMRRNAESLLVLAGIDSGRRLRDAMPLSDVIRTASSEIEQYDRIELDLQVDPHMLGFNALGAAHLLAELLENATVFSEPETAVTVSTGVVGQFVAVKVVDSGLGMSDAEIEAANAKIASTGAGEMLGAQRLGLFVVGRIAHRLGAAVQLAKSPTGTGTETTVLFPAHLFAATETALYGTAPDSPAELAALVESEAPAAEAVDLAALTDGETSLGLPRRRRGDGDEPSTESAEIPVAAVPTGLPSRPRKTFDEDNLVLPAAPSGNLTADISAAGSDWSPETVNPGAGGLPSRTRAGTSAWQQPDAETPAATTPASPAARAGLFSGFRGRTAAELAADENVASESGAAPAADPVRAPWMALGGAHAAPEVPIVVPSLVDEDEEPWAPVQADASVDEVPGLVSDEEPAAAWAAPVAEPAAEWSAPVVEEPAAEWTAPVVEEPAAQWTAPEVAEPAAQWTAPVVEEPAAEWTAPVVEEPADEWTAPVVEEPADEWTAPVVEEPAAEWTAPEWSVAEPAAQWTAPVVEEPAAEWTSPEVAEPAAEWTAPVVEEPAAEWTAPVAEEPAEQWTAPEAAQPVVEPARAFTSYSGYAGWSAAAAAAAAPSSSDFERTLDEARAWHTGAIPAIPEPHTEPESAPAWPTPTWDAVPSWEEPAAVVPQLEAEPEVAPESVVEPEPVAEVALEPAAEEPEWAPTTPAWGDHAWTTPELVADEDTQLFTPVEAAGAVEPLSRRGADVEPAAEPVVEPVAEPVAEWSAPEVAQPVAEVAPEQAALAQPAWAPTAVGTSRAPEGFADVVQAAPAEKGRKRFGLFGKRKSEEVAVEAPAPLQQQPVEPVRSSAWAQPAQVAPVAPVAEQPAGPSWAASWNAPSAPEPTPVAPEPVAPHASWSAPEWARPAAGGAAPLSSVPHPSLPPSVAPRVGTLDDDVAAMLALRSDIQEQALSELSQLSAYRPAAVGGQAERLTKRVPTAMPAAAPGPGESAAPVQRDADELRSRLSNFQSGTSRGRRAAGDSADQNSTTS